MSGTLTRGWLEGGYVLTHPRTQWSCVRVDTQAVGLSVWDHEIDRSASPWEVDTRQHPGWSDVQGHAGNRRRIRDISQGLAQFGGVFELVLLTARFSRDAPERRLGVKTASFWKGWQGVIAPDEFNPTTGQFRLVITKRR